MRKLLVLLSIILAVVLVGCGKQETDKPKQKKFTIAFGVGTYEEQFRKGILPILKKKVMM
ncbi:hypothetical protein [Staphylococcus carnosus]|uniref:hypothetical protein n=1 Tax=Staphylococcus carnosus TaxID=1281 RepID=UPI000B007F7D|nr:hypothetical protein [Staphylococcus carnosus]GEP79558.1 hypothetical protein SCA05_13510 [Staphylococcus carnosus]SUM05796.1 Uncharacterised protein [Staphylococcus carnosus]